MHPSKLVSVLLAALLVAAPAALTAVPASPRPAAAVSLWDAALASVQAIITRLLPISGFPAPDLRPRTTKGQAADNCGSTDPDGHCKP